MLSLLLEFELLWDACMMLAHLAGLTVRVADLDDAAERARIDAYLAARADAAPFHRPEWLRGVEHGTGQRAYYLVADAPGGAIAGLLPLTRIASPLFGRALVSSGFGVGGGILAATDAAVEALAESAWALAERERCATVELRGGAFPAGWAREQGIHAGFVRDLPADDAAILQSIPRKQRAEVRRALGLGLEIEVGAGEALLDPHYRIYAESVRNLGTPVFPRALFAAMAREWADRADILVVRSRGTPVAAVLSLYDKGTVHPYWGGGTRAARALRANDLMYYALMRHAAERGCRSFDFGRSKVGTGAFAFKKNWGFAPTPLVYAQRGAGRDLDPRSPRHRLQVKVWRKLPLGLANAVGPIIARGLG